jgi:hypothetical protein
MTVIENGTCTIANAGNGLSCSSLFLKYKNIYFNTSLFPHAINSINSLNSSGVSNCIVCGNTNNNLKFRLIRKNRNNQHYKHQTNSNQYYADICNACSYNNLFICSHTYLPSDKCINGKWRKNKIWVMTMLYYLGLIPMDVVRYIYEFMWLIDIDMRILDIHISNHTCERHFDVHVVDTQ